MEKEKRALELNIAELQHNVVADPNVEQRKENLARLERIRHRFEIKGKGEYKTLTPYINRQKADLAEGGQVEEKKCASPSCTDLKPHGSVPIEMCESKLNSVRNKLYNSHNTDHISPTGSIPSLVVSNRNKCSYLGNKPLVLMKDKYEAVDWDTLDNLVEGKKESSTNHTVIE